MKPIAVIVLLAILPPLLAETREVVGPDRPSEIVGGKDVSQEFPFVGQVWVREELEDDEEAWYTCSGTLIHERWILTAAHCFDYEKVELDDTTICLRPNGCRTGQYLSTTDVEVRPGYGGSNEDGITWSNSQFDQALIRLRWRTTSFSPVAVSTTTAGVALTGALVGWGLVRWGPDMDEDRWEGADTLQKLPVYIVKNHYLDLFQIHNPKPGLFGGVASHVAPGDSGGPVLIWTING